MARTWRPLDRFRRPLPRGDLEVMVEEAMAALQDGDAKRALDVARNAVRQADVAGHKDLLCNALVVQAAAHHELGAFKEARDDALRATAVDRYSAPAWSELAEALHRLGEPGAAVDACDRALHLDPDDANTWNQLGRTVQWIDMERAHLAFTHAARLAPEHFVVPVRVSAAQFDALAQRSWERLPHGLQGMLSNAIAAVEPLPDGDDVRQGLDPDVLCTYEGGTALDGDGVPERILLFQHNLENICSSVEALTEEVRRTIVHEVGHHLGMDHDELPF